MRRMRLAVIWLLLMVILALGAIVALQYKAANERESLNTQVIKSVEREEKVVLLSLGIQGISQEKARGSVWGVDIPFSDRTQLIQYSYKAKLGIDGERVKVEQTGEHAYKVKVPEFIFIGHSDEKFQTAVEDNGVMSWVTPEIDAADTVSKILDEGEKDKNIKDNRKVLESQARDFYTQIITSVDEEAKVDVQFA